MISEPLPSQEKGQFQIKWQTAHTYSNGQRVTKSMVQMQTPDVDGLGLLLCSDTMYGSAMMDGKLKVMRLQNMQDGTPQIIE